MRRRLSLIARGFLQVAPVGGSQVSTATFGAAIVAGNHDRALVAGAAVVCLSFLISFVWWINAGSAGKVVGGRGAAWYGLGAAIGAVCGALLVATFLR